MMSLILIALLIVTLVSLILNFMMLKKINSTNTTLGQITNNISDIIKQESLMSRTESAGSSKQLREEVANSLGRLGDSLSQRINELSENQKRQLDSFSSQMIQLIRINEEKFGRLDKSVSENLTNYNNSVIARITEMVQIQREQFKTFSTQMDTLISKVEQKTEAVRTTVEQKLQSIQNDNTQKLEQMRKTVDEKLHETLEKRLGESFKVVSDQLDRVGQGLGEMKVLASGVGDLKKVLSNVKTRGTLGEVQLAAILDQILTPEQYATNVPTKPRSRETVEFAVKLPGQNDAIVLLPIDAKFPTEDYQRLVEAQEQGNLENINAHGEALESRIKQQAKDIRDKYINPPSTTDFGVLYLPFEGLYAEVLRRPGLYEYISRQFKITIAGPTTIAALLNSLQMGFRTLAIQKRAGEVWQLLGAVKTEFGKFGEIFEKAHGQIIAAGNTLELAKSKSRNIERKLRKVEILPAHEATALLESAEEATEDGGPEMHDFTSNPPISK